MLCGSAATVPQDSKAAEIVRHYLKIPHPEDDRSGKARSERLDILSELKTMPEDAIAAIGSVLPEVKNPLQRVELAEALGQHLHTKDSAALLCKLLKDPDEKVRWQAIHSLRLLARRTDRVGAKRTQRRPDFRSNAEKEKAVRQAIGAVLGTKTKRTIDPKDERSEELVEFAPEVEGLVPYLVSAANDEVENNRICALYALADTRDPLAVSELRNRLKDPSENVRNYAACFLTEYQDASGLPEMRGALVRLCRTDPNSNWDYYRRAEMLLTSFERITGKSFGEIPLNPHLCSDTRQIPVIEKRYNTLLNTWAEWWAWEPKASEKTRQARCVSGGASKSANVIIKSAGESPNFFVSHNAKS